jgi:hypothetical protein
MKVLIFKTSYPTQSTVNSHQLRNNGLRRSVQVLLTLKTEKFNNNKVNNMENVTGYGIPATITTMM